MGFEVRKQNRKKAIFKDGVQIAEWFDRIFSYGLVLGQSNYFIAKKNDKIAIYEYKDGNVIKITDDFENMYSYGLVEG